MSDQPSNAGVQLEALQWWPGAHAGLSQPTATCRLTFPDQLLGTPLSVFRDSMQQLWPQAPVLNAEADWPSGVWMGPPPEPSVAAWCVALVVSLQRLARDPVGGARVVAEEGASAEVGPSSFRVETNGDNRWWS